MGAHHPCDCRRPRGFDQAKGRVLLSGPKRAGIRISNDPSPVKAARELLEGRYNADAEAFRQGADVRALVHSRADTVDTVLRLIWNRYPFSGSPDIALIAVGGYGRGELHPQSDIDLLILTRNGIEDSWHEDLGAFVTLLWDLRLDIGHSVRSIEESKTAAREDITILTNLLETRTIAGPDELRSDLSEQVYSDDVSTDRDYFIAKREEQQQRHRKYGDTEYNLEPNVKGSRVPCATYRPLAGLPSGISDCRTLQT